MIYKILVRRLAVVALGLLAVAVPGLSFSDWFTAIPIVNPTTTTVTVSTPTTTTAPSTLTSSGPTQWFCIVTATGAIHAGPFSTEPTARAACGSPRTTSFERQLVERVRVTDTTSTTTTVTTIRDRTTPRYNVIGGPQVELTPAQAQIVVIAGGGGGSSGGGGEPTELNPLASINTLEITYPKAIAASPNGLDADNRAYYAYPSIEYAIPLAAVGGMPPFNWSGSNLPSGAVVESYTSESGQPLWRLRWPAPATDATDVVVTVEDVHGATDSETFSIDVQTAKFRFVDAVSGNDANDGTSVAQAWQTLFAVWDSGLKDQIIYFMTGVYNVDGITLGGGGLYAHFDADSGGGGRPTQWLAYPGESPEIDLQAMGGDTPFIRLSEAEAIFVDGFEVYGDWTIAFQVQLDESRGSVFANNHFHTGGEGVESSNSAFVMTVSTVGGLQYGTVFANNNFADAGHNALKLYTQTKPLIEGNLFDDNDGIAEKDSVVQYTVQLNKAQNINASAALVTGNHNGAVQDTTGEIRFNLVLSTSGDAVDLVQGWTNPVGVIDSYRNTYIGSVNVADLGQNDGERRFTRDVVINSVGAGGEITQDPAHNGAFTATETEDWTKLVETDLLQGEAADNIVDAGGLLQGTSRTNYGPGTSARRGHEIG